MKKTNTLLASGLVIFFLANTAVFAEMPENMNPETNNTNSFDNLNQAKSNSVNAKSAMLDTVLNRKEENRRATARAMPINTHNNNTPLPKTPTEKATGRVKTRQEEMDERNKFGKTKPKKNPTKPIKPTVKPSKNKANASNFFARKSVVISAQLAKIVGVIASEYKKLTGDPIIISSATRDAKSQSVAMMGRIDKLGEKGVQNLYKNKIAVKQILDAYRLHRNNRPMAIKAMTKVIENQVAQKVYISRHLKSGAIDVSRISNPKALRKAVAKVGGTTFYEFDHWHCDLPLSKD